MDTAAARRSRVRPSWVFLGGLGLLGLVAVGVPLTTLLYIGVLLLCPLMMVGMHGGHGHDDGHDHGLRDDDASAADHGVDPARR